MIYGTRLLVLTAALRAFDIFCTGQKWISVSEEFHENKKV